MHIINIITVFAYTYIHIYMYIVHGKKSLARQFLASLFFIVKRRKVTITKFSLTKLDL